MRNPNGSSLPSDVAPPSGSRDAANGSFAAIGDGDRRDEVLAVERAAAERAVHDARDRLREEPELPALPAELQAGVERPPEHLAVPEELQDLLARDALQVERDLERRVGARDGEVRPRRRHRATERLEACLLERDLVAVHADAQRDVPRVDLAHAQHAEAQVRHAGEPGERGGVERLRGRLLLRGAALGRRQEQLVEVEPVAPQLRLEPRRRLRARRPARSTFALPSSLDRRTVSSIRVEPHLLAALRLTVRACRVQRHRISRLLRERPAGPEIRAREVERASKRARPPDCAASSLHHQGHRRARRLRELLGHDEPHGREVDPRLRRLRRLAARAADDEPHRARHDRAAHLLPERRVVRRERLRVEAAPDDLEPLEPGRVALEAGRAPLSDERGGPRGELELADAQIARGDVRLEVRVERHVQRLPSLLSREGEPGRAEASLHAARPGAARHRRAEIRGEIRLEAPAAEPHLGGQEGSERVEDDRRDLEHDLLRHRLERGGQRRRLDAQLEVLLLREHGGAHDELERLAGLEVLHLHVEVVDVQLLRAGDGPVEERDSRVLDGCAIDPQHPERGLLRRLRRGLGRLLGLRLREPLAHPLHVRRAVGQLHDVEAQALDDRLSDVDLLAERPDRTEEVGLHLGAAELGERQGLALGRPDRHVGHADAEATPELGRDATDLHRATELARERLCLLPRLREQDPVEREEHAGDEDHEDDDGGGEDLRPAPMRTRLGHARRLGHLAFGVIGSVGLPRRSLPRGSLKSFIVRDTYG